MKFIETVADFHQYPSFDALTEAIFLHYSHIHRWIQEDSACKLTYRSMQEAVNLLSPSWPGSKPDRASVVYWLHLLDSDISANLLCNYIPGQEWQSYPYFVIAIQQEHAGDPILLEDTKYTDSVQAVQAAEKFQVKLPSGTIYIYFYKHIGAVPVEVAKLPVTNKKI